MLIFISRGEGTDQEEPFREWFSQIGQLRSLCPEVPLVALTATSGPSNRRKIMKMLCFRVGCEIITESPDRQNIKISSLQINDNIESTFMWLLDDLKKSKGKLPRHIIFCETISTVSKVYATFYKFFNKKKEHFEMYHSKTPDNKKDEIRMDMAEDGHIRILICTNSAGMGVNFHGANNIIHYGLPREMDTFVQQMGRGGRDGSLANELVLYKAHKGHLKNVESDLVKLCKDNAECRRKLLCEGYVHKAAIIIPLHNRCDICERKCECGHAECPRTHPAFNQRSEDADSDEEDMKRQTSESEKSLLHHKLNLLKYELSDFHSTQMITDMICGLTDEVIDNIVKYCDTLFSPDDVMRKFPKWNYDIAIKICSIISDVFGDTDMYTINESEDDF